MVSSIVLKAGDIAHHDSIELSKFSVVASYNWLDEPQPTILVPGIPPIWSPPSDTPGLRPDTGTRYIDQNQDRMPNSPLEPLIYAIQAHRPEFDFSAVDIITDRRSLRQLYGFIIGDKKGFLFGVEVVGDAMIFTRHEPQSRETVPPNKFIGYRESFEEAYTKLHPVAQGSTSHHRLITYTLGGLQFLVRSGTDGYCSSVAGRLPDPVSDSHTSEDEFTKSIKSLSLNKVLPSTPTASPGADKLLVKKGGFDIPQATVFELSTHTAFKPSIIESKMVDLYFSQTSCFVEASFRSRRPQSNLGSRCARFEEINIQDVTQSCERWEKDHQDELRRLTHVLKQIVSGARALGCPAIVKYTGGKNLLIERVGDRSIPTLPEKFRSLFFRKQGKDTIEVCEQAEGLSSRNEKAVSWDL